jgi:alkylated DNA repair dioxygenase AlkB
MNTLFPLETNYPPGFVYLPDFITADEEKELMQIILQIEVHPMQFHGYTGKRKVASFGYDWSFEKQQLSKGKDIPVAFDPILRKIAKQVGVKKEALAELLITEYPVGSVINWHRDAPPFEIIAGLSLMADCTFRLRPHDKSKQSRSTTISFPVKPRSLYIIQGAARTDWEHSTAPVKAVRYSLTLRTLKNQEQ